MSQKSVYYRGNGQGRILSGGRPLTINLEQLDLEGSLRSFITAVKNATRSSLRRIGFDLIRYNPQKSHEAALARLLVASEIDTVLDVGANEGQYATMVRRAGVLGKKGSFPGKPPPPPTQPSGAPSLPRP